MLLIRSVLHASSLYQGLSDSSQLEAKRRLPDLFEGQAKKAKLKQGCPLSKLIDIGDAVWRSYEQDSHPKRSRVVTGLRHMQDWSIWSAGMAGKPKLAQGALSARTRTSGMGYRCSAWS